MTTAFPEVRLKRFLEMRGADGGQWRRLCALPALWVGLLYDGTALDARLAHGTFAHPKLLVLVFRCHSGRRLCVLIAPDMIEADGLRRLRTRLRCEPAQDA